MKERRVWIEVGYGLEEWITDGFAGETSREVMTPEFRQGRYGPGLLAGTTRIIGRIAQGRNVQLTGVEVPRDVGRRAHAQIPFRGSSSSSSSSSSCSRMGGGPGARRPALGARWLERLVERRRSVWRRLGVAADLAAAAGSAAALAGSAADAAAAAVVAAGGKTGAMVHGSVGAR